MPADLPTPSALYNRNSGKGYSGRMFLNGEEAGPDGRAFAHIVTGPGAGISYGTPLAWQVLMGERARKPL